MPDLPVIFYSSGHPKKQKKRGVKVTDADKKNKKAASVPFSVLDSLGICKQIDR